MRMGMRPGCYAHSSEHVAVFGSTAGALLRVPAVFFAARTPARKSNQSLYVNMI